MITEFPALVYRCPGQYPGPHGKTYDTRPVATAEALEAALRDGWHWGLEGAALGLEAPAETPPDAPTEAAIEDVPKPAPEPAPEPTRADLVAEAEWLGIDVDGRWSEKRLRREIDAAKVANP
jgi:hypothetical protein